VPPWIEGSERLVTAIEGDVAMLHCIATGIPVPKITWIQDGQGILSSDSRHEIQGSGTLIISDVQVGLNALHVIWLGN